MLQRCGVWGCYRGMGVLLEMLTLDVSDVAGNAGARCEW